MVLSNPEKTIRKIDIAQVSLNLQDRLGLAKVKYQNGRLPVRESRQGGGLQFLGSDKPSDSSSDISHSRCETPLTSPPLRTASYSKELPRSSRNKHAATFNSRMMQPMLSASRKRLRSDSITDRPVKATRVSWKSSYQLPESSPGFRRQHHPGRHHLPLAETAPIPEFSSPGYHVHSEDDNDPDLPVHSFRNASSVVGSSPPRTPPPKHSSLSRNDRTLRHEDGADLLLYLANSPTPASIAKPQPRAFPPSTPPSQHAVPGGGGVFPNFGTPNQQFNFADFVNVTPSPAQPVWGGRTPGGIARTPLATKDGRKRSNFDNLLPPGVESPKNRAKGPGLVLQLGGELRP
ncbi:hypothetical protein P175DRAFT_0500646 [Aspergillus ochraceoroseus IBT 24754]|uniref:Uncharacterized protein n=3 Tax=Aspergillus subgen. Nidulantes TaxID=2720870 RepID=A0A0F8W540_9EURO|nr:uncharacterized protein P175DRAFT_0500646 [Aspergillus ochraceoroseus IBT 24754]KKK13015.1 hypothetical protein ARAM_001865 [Aspergillus rambellii]KKK13578.1 hypothetical protein AOCH_001024 [Aspergillus ochraceoroseus]PTU21768.1 hypothetical protein P175DRAFT_0500646 [Aspergillus ochraceoroseus IBT 24754]